jgi:protein-S-isoprenylcysteine O-methyltransferase Ste14
MHEPRVSAIVVAWGGGVVFVASLLWFLYSYAVRFDAAPPTAAASGPIVYDVLLFSLFAVHHSVLARTGVKRLVSQVVSPHLERSIYTWSASLLFIAVCTWWKPIPGVMYAVEGPGRLAAYAIQFAGVIMTIRASKALDVLDLAGVRAVLQADRPDGSRHVPLETGGLYGIVRHPVYLAWAVFVFATPVMTATRAVFAIVSTAYLAIAIPWEERSLIEIFGAEYEAYRKKVRWRMVPGIY